MLPSRPPGYSQEPENRELPPPIGTILSYISRIKYASASFDEECFSTKKEHPGEFHD
jgi:hypothetical protein